MGCSDIAGNCRACRIKTQEESPKIFIFNTVKLPDIFKETTSLDIHENDGLPKVLCCSCYDRLLDAYNFRKMCSAAALHFQEILSMEISEEKYNPPETQSNPHLTETSLTYIKIESDSDDPSSPLRNDQDHLPDDASSDISDSISFGDKALDAIKAEPDDDASLISHVNKDRDKGLRIPEDPTKLECGICNSSFHNKSRLEMHIWTEHLPFKARECKICGMEFKSASSLSNHLRTHENTKATEDRNDNNQHVCVFCGVGNKTEEELRNHSNTHKKNKKWLCVYCNFRTIKKFNLQRHVKTVHHGAKRSHDSHFSQSQGSFRTEASPRNHTERVEVVKKQVSRVSEIKTVTESGLNSHMTTNATKKHITCELCSMKFSRRANLTQHVKIVHQRIKNHHCSVCKKSFGTSKSLKNHFMLHTGERPHACTKCPKRFIASDKLKMHMKTHTRENILSCELCPFTTACNYRMKRHVKSVHETVKDYQCPHCGRAFSTLIALKSHVLTHCNECGMRFSQRSNLMIHLKTHLESISKA